MNQKFIETILLLLLHIVLPIKNDSLCTADFVNTVVPTTIRTVYNSVGVSMYLQDTYNHFGNPLFQHRMNNSRLYGYYINALYQSFHVPVGYKYGCTPSLYNVTNSSLIKCAVDLSANTTILTQMANFFNNYGDWYAVDLGWDMQLANFSNRTGAYFLNFRKYQNLFFNARINLQVADFGDKLTSQLGTNFTVTTFMTHMGFIKSNYPNLYFTGPGITQDADSSWISQLANITTNYPCTFTFRLILFRNNSLATISNLLDDTYSKGFLNSILINANRSAINLTQFPIGINEMRITNDSGIDGITNSFAAALWAIDISAQFISRGGRFINFYTTLNASFQSVIGPSPTFAPSALYHGLLFALYAFQPNMALLQYPAFFFAGLTPGLSSNIKIYGFSFSAAFRVLIINKDTNRNLTGTVDLLLPYKFGVSCIYLKANNLTSTQGVTFAGMQFIANSTNYLGAYQNFVYNLSNTGYYNINVSYAQAVVCDTLFAPNQSKFTRGKSNLNYQSSSFISISLLLIVVMSIYL